jgi:hypothetical protein
MHCEYCGKEFQENEMCACRSSEEQVRQSSFPLWLIPGVICAVITLGYMVLMIVGCNYFLWVHIVWLISAIAFFFLLMRKIKHYKRTFTAIGIIILTVFLFATIGRAVLYVEFLSLNGYIEYVCYNNDIDYAYCSGYMEQADYNGEYVFVSDLVDKLYGHDIVYVGALAYKYQNCIWYGPLYCRWIDFFDYYMPLWRHGQKPPVVQTQ